MHADYSVALPLHYNQKIKKNKNGQTKTMLRINADPTTLKIMNMLLN